MNNFTQRLPEMYKAVAAFISLLIPFLSSVASASTDGVVTSSEWFSIGVAFTTLVGGTVAVYKVSNRPKGVL